MTTTTDEKMPDLTALRAPMQALHDSGLNATYAWRIEQLRTLRTMLLDTWEDLIDALYADLGKERTEAVGCELQLVLVEIDLALAQLRSWMRPQKVAAPVLFAPSFHRLEHRPLLGPAVLVIGPFNYPVNLTLTPIVGALAAGNPVVCKPSELTPVTSYRLEKAIHKHFAPDVMRVVNGGVPLTTALLEQPWGKVFFTGSERVGKIVAVAAAKTLTPVVLELGGKCPAIVDETAPYSMQTIANRITWGRLLNAGQTCVSPDVAYVHETLLEEFLTCAVRSIGWQFGSQPRDSELGRIVTTHHAQRLQDMIYEMEQSTSSSTRIVLGSAADCDPSKKYICPTIAVNPPLHCRAMREEIFGPILCVRTFATRDEVIDMVRSQGGTPLALYVFTRHDKVLQEYSYKIRAGAVFRNDCSMHVGSSDMPFGGLGTSGMGRYHGKYSFDAFSQVLSVSFRPAWPGTDLGLARFHPFAGTKGWLVENVVLSLPKVPVLHSRALIMSAAVVAIGLTVWPTTEGITALKDSICSWACKKE